MLNKELILEEIIFEVNGCSSLESLLSLLAKETKTIIKYDSLHLFASLKEQSIEHHELSDAKLSSQELFKDSFFDYLNRHNDNYFLVKLEPLKQAEKNSEILNSIESNYLMCFRLFVSSKNIGFISFSSNKEFVYDENKIKILSNFINLFAVYISNFICNKQLNNKNRDETDNLNALGFKHLFEIASSFNTILDYDEAAKVIIEKIASSINVSQGYLISFEVDNYSKIIATVNENSLLNTKIEVTDALKQAIVSKDIVAYNYKNTRSRCLDLKYALIIPLFIKSKLIGLICLGEMSADKERIFTEHDIKLVQTIANQAVITLENAQLYNKLEDMVVERTVELIDSNKALQKQKEKLEILSQRLQAIISSIPDGILVINKDNQILSSNPAFMNMLNFVSNDIQIDSLIGLSLMKLITFISNNDDKNIKNLGNLLTQIVDKEEQENNDLDLVLENGTSHYYKVLTAPVKITGESIHRIKSSVNEKNNQVIVFHDVTKEKEIDKLKSDFIAVVSHELKTPVSAMMGFANLIEDGMSDDITDDQQDYLNKIQIQGERLIRLINDLLDFSKLEAGQMPLYLQLLDADEVITEIVETLRPLADEKSMTLRSNIEIDLPPICIDPDKLKQILINLISNAIKFTPENTGLIEAKVILDQENKSLLFSVSDNGIGIPDRDKAKLFDRFYQVDNSSTRRYGGTGLGLAIVKKLVDLNNGQVWVDSKIGSGSTFYFTV
ncbi:MAG: GAF domain-containing protein, partial [Candidatus Sericytochromatia bacterium]|nr:GAF domain-containing protein [Candidatus Sericytochromatia bacterium]